MPADGTSSSDQNGFRDRTTDKHTDDPDDQTVLQSEVDAMLDSGRSWCQASVRHGTARLDRRATVFEDAKESVPKPARHRRTRCSTTSSEMVSAAS